MAVGAEIFPPKFNFVTVETCAKFVRNLCKNLGVKGGLSIRGNFASFIHVFATTRNMVYVAYAVLCKIKSGETI